MSKARLPSIDELRDFLATSPGPVGKREIAKAFGLKGQSKIELKALLKSLEGKGQVSRKGKRIAGSGMLPPVCVLEITHIDDDGHCFATPTEWDSEKSGPPPTIVLRNDQGMTSAPGMGDRILARIEALPKEREAQYSARVMKPISREATRIVGVFRKDGSGKGRIQPTGKKDRYDFLVPHGDDGDAQDGELVSAEITRQAARGLPQARVRQRLGDAKDPRNTSLIAIHGHGIPDQFSEFVLGEAKALKSFTLDGREDLRHLPLLTIDPRDARDHDDAVWAAADTDPANEGGHLVIVAIADVAAYVRPGTSLDREARRRGNSVYFPDRVVPMLPERISNNLCSLIEGEDRPALACHMVFDAKGKKLRHHFTRAVMRSAAKLAYEDAQAAIDGRKSHPLLETALRPLWAAYKAVSVARDKRSPLDLDLPEKRILLDKQGRVASVVVPERLDAHRLIEEFMIQANVAAAEELIKRRTPLLLRVHEEPSKEKLRSLAEFLQSVSIPFALGQVVRSKHFNGILKQAKDTPQEKLVHEVVLRSQAQANYRPENAGHFGLNLANYAHFTSPIRRYADLIVHRALITALKLGPDGLSPQDISGLEETAELISVAERRAMIAERETTDRLVASHLAAHLGANFRGTIRGVVGAGLFVTLDETGADGFVPVQSLGRSYFVLDETRHALIASDTGETFQLGDGVEIKLTEVAPVRGGLKFDMVSDGKKGKAPTRQRPHRRKRR